MNIPCECWKEAVLIRKSIRTFNNQPISYEIKDSLSQFIESANSKINGVRAVYVEDGGDKVVQSIVGSYGLIKGVRSYIAFVADGGVGHFHEKTGYLGEMCVLEATSSGLGTCWISGTFRPELVKRQLNISPFEKVMAITPVGYAGARKSIVERLMKKAVGSHKRRSLDELCPEGYNQDWPAWIKEALKLARTAPSAANRQPWRFKVSDDTREIIVFIDDKGSFARKRLDCGIAMLHIEIGALCNGIKGEWRYLEKPEIAVFSIS